ncbi:MAG: hypothetical protein P4L77_00345 [Sulfuriferula sp.]|nr:hypothetical protein [Sulfuriferula sp.]
MRLRGIVLILGWLVAVDALAVPPLGRLFYTPQQRQQIDNQHKPLVRHELPAAPEGAHYSGYVKRSDGVDTIWLNGRMRAVDPSAVKSGQFKLPATPALKPGQEFDRQSGRVLEPYERALPVEQPVASATTQPLILQPLADDSDDAAGANENAAAH